MRETIQWTAPSPLWENALGSSSAAVRREELNRPAVLRFTTDSFMDDFLQMLANDPQRLGQYAAMPETWRGVAPSADATESVPAFARNIKRLGLNAARRREKIGGLIRTSNKFTQFASAKASQPLKLYQPAHQRFYLISACLVCERPGLPDKIPNNEREEKVSYVLRRLFPPGALRINDKLPDLDASWEEYAFVMTDRGAKWKRVLNENALVEGEEQLPLFAVNFNEDDGRRRKLYAGVIPAGKREAYLAAGDASTVGANGAAVDSIADSRVILMRSQFRDPWKSLLQTASHARTALADSSGSDAEAIAAQKDIVKNSREQMQTISWLILLDFANFLAANVTRVWNALNNPANASALNAAETNLFNVLTNTTLDEGFAIDLADEADYETEQVERSLKNALLAVKPANAQAAGQIEKNLETVVISYNRHAPDSLYPNFLFPLADLKFSLKTVLTNQAVAITPTDFSSGNFAGEDQVNKIAQLVEAALPTAAPNQPLQMLPLASQTPMDMREGFFLLRCVYERPLCGAIEPPILSQPTKAFQIAGFFDPDAPARPIRIALPIDPTPAGLRKFNKNTAFMMSDLLCGQVNRMKGITLGDLIRSVLPFPLHKDLSVPDAGGCKDGSGVSIGMMCSLSIPIITICALILLMIIVSLLDFIFRWLPFFIVCFPLPGLKSKNE